LLLAFWSIGRPTAAGLVHEVKLDGWRVQVRVEDGTATTRTRNGHDYTATFPEIAKAARAFDDCIFDGEIRAVGTDGLTDFSALQAAMKGDKPDKLVLFAFDLLFLGSKDMRSHHLMERKAELQTLIEANPDQSVIRFHDHLDATGRCNRNRLRHEAGGDHFKAAVGALRLRSDWHLDQGEVP
jgi:bifunctional non-homologous end joining protein LigD